MVEAREYDACVAVITKAKEAGLTAILVFKPRDVFDENDDPTSPDMIVCTSTEANIIASLLGNFPANTYTSDEMNKYQEQLGPKTKMGL